MNILLLVRSLGRGGAERQVVALATGLAGRGHAVSLVSFYAGGDWVENLCAAGVRVHSLDKAGRWDVLRLLPSLVNIVRQERPAIVHGFLPVANLLALTVRLRVPSTKVVWGVRSSWVDLKAYSRVSALTYFLERRLARLADLIIVNSEAGARLYKRFAGSKGRVRVIHNGIDTVRFRPDDSAGRALRRDLGISETAALIGMIARLDPMKDHENFLQAAKIATERRPELQFVCVGGPDSRVAQYSDRAAALGLGNRVLWLGERRDLTAIYNALDVATLISHGEGFPNVLAEAMACGRPCVASDVGAAPEIVGTCGTIVPSNDPDVVAAAWLDLLDRPEEEWHALAARARERVESKFGSDAMIDATIAALDALKDERV